MGKVIIPLPFTFKELRIIYRMVRKSNRKFIHSNKDMILLVKKVDFLYKKNNISIGNRKLAGTMVFFFSPSRVFDHIFQISCIFQVKITMKAKMRENIEITTFYKLTDKIFLSFLDI